MKKIFGVKQIFNQQIELFIEINKLTFNIVYLNLLKK